MPKYRGKRKRRGHSLIEEPESEEAPALTTSMVWAGKSVKVNTLTVKDTFDPTVPIDQPGEEGDDGLIWADLPAALKERLKNKPQQITQECLKMNAEGVLRMYENDIVQHVICQQLRIDSMSSLLRRQGKYGQSQQTAGAVQATANKLAKSSFLGREPTGNAPYRTTCGKATNSVSKARS